MANKIKSRHAPGKKKKNNRHSSPEDFSSRQSILQQAMSLHQSGRLSQAEALYRQILTADQNNPDALHLLGMLAHETGRSELGIELIKKALGIKPDYFKAYNSLGIILNARGKLDEAVASYRQALIIQPDYAAAHNNLGNTLRSQERLGEAIASYRQALALQPDFAEAHYNLGNALNVQGKLDEAIESYQRALTLQPDYGEVYFDLGNACKDLGRLDEAVASYRQALFLQPDFAEVYNNLGITLSNKGKLDEAVSCFRQALALQPDHADIHYNLGNTLKNMGKLNEAETCFSRALALEPDFAEAHYSLGFIYRESGRLDKAIVCFRTALLQKPDYPKAYKGLTSLVKYAEVDKDIQAMEDIYNNEATSDTDRIDLGFALGKVFEDLQVYDKAFKFIFEANRLKRGSYEYTIQEDQDFFARIKHYFSPDFFTSHHGSGNQDNTPIFILGMPRSGTTLVEQILASHPLVFGAGELRILKSLINSVCSRGKPKEQFPECILEFDLASLEKLGSDYIKQIRKYSIDVDFITDKMPHNFLYVGLIKIILPNAKIVHCIRDPMDNCFSIFKKDFTGRHDYAYDMVEIGHYYTLYRDLMSHWEKVLPGFMHTLKYEKLISNQLVQTKSLLKFCGLPWDEACLAFHKTKRSVSTASLAQVRQPIYKSSVELWKRYKKQLEPLREAIHDA